MFGPIPEVVAGAGAIAVFAFALLAIVCYILKSQQSLITNHLSDGTKALQDLTMAIERLIDRLDR